jgi:hypothetical protein
MEHETGSEQTEWRWLADVPVRPSQRDDAVLGEDVDERPTELALGAGD